MTMVQDPVVIVEALRTPIGAFNGALKRLSAPELAAIAIRGVIGLSKIHPEDITEVLMGCVLTAGVGQAPARQATLKAGLSVSVPATTISKVCGSGMKTVMLAHDQIMVDSEAVLLAGGMESMSNSPTLQLKEKHRSGKETVDHLFYDGLEDAYTNKTMGVFAEETVKLYGFSRADQDQYALESLDRARKATNDEKFLREIVPIAIDTPGGDVEIEVDEPLNRAKPEKIPHLKPVFDPAGTITAANASGITDGAAVLLLMRASKAKKLGLKARAKIVAHSSFAQVPEKFTTAPVGAVQAVLKKAGWIKNDVDLFEINEAFAVVTMACMKELGLPHDKVNIYGGACALGHPIGASGARILVTLLNALEQTNKQKGVASLCIGGGEATAVAIERMVS